MRKWFIAAVVSKALAILGAEIGRGGVGGTRGAVLLRAAGGEARPWAVVQLWSIRGAQDIGGIAVAWRRFRVVGHDGCLERI